MKKRKLNTIAAKSVLVLMCAIALFNPFIANKDAVLIKTEEGIKCPACRQWAADWFGHADTENMLDVSHIEGKLLIPPLLRYDYRQVATDGEAFLPPGSPGKKGRHWLGTDHLGRDVLASIIRGFFVSFKIVVFVLLFGFVFGTFVGVASAYYGNKGLKINLLQACLVLILFCLLAFYLVFPLIHIARIWHWIIVSAGLLFFAAAIKATHALPLKKFDLPLDLFVLKIIEVVKSIPGLILIMAVIPIFSDRSITNIIIILVFFMWTIYARHSRAETFSITQKDFVLSARAGGLPDLLIMIRHVLPNILPTLLVLSAMLASGIILLESSISFLGIGLPVGEASWGNMLALARNNTDAWWLAVFPGMCIFLVILCLNVLVDFSLKLDER